MRVHTLVEYQWDGETYILVREEGFDYPDDAPVARCDRAAQSAFGNAARTAGSTAATLGGEGQAAGATLTPFYKREMNAQHMFTPGQTQELLTAAEAPLAASAATTAGQAASERARTRNAAGFSAALDQNARDRQAALGKAGLDIAAQDVLGAKEQQQEGAKGEAGLYGIDTDAQLKAMGLQNEALQGQVEAGKSGWFQNLMQGIGTVGKLFSPIKIPGTGGGNSNS